MMLDTADEGAPLVFLPLGKHSRVLLAEVPLRLPDGPPTTDAERT